ncbi:MAG: M48 family metallopeptidase [Anaerolineae bacterium]|nr:M48 family metallopeptidase [Anaerolineae bacterium]
MTTLPAYTVRESARARHVNLKISLERGLEVVIPRGFNRRRIPDILQKKQAWIKRTVKRLEERRLFLAGEPALPEQIRLQAVAETWSVAYRPTSSAQITVTEKAGQRLILSGNVADVDQCQTALRKWVARKAKQHLTPWLRQLGQVEQLPFDRVTFRGQKTRWGSCSGRKTISLNYKLLFLPPALVRYVLIHELCHTKHLNHSAKFWTLVGQKEPNYKQLKKELRASWCYVPGWVQD